MPKAVDWAPEGMVYRSRYPGRRALLRRFYRPYSREFDAFVQILVINIDAPGQYKT